MADRCPRCTFTLVPKKHAGAVVELCPRCHGSFLDLGDARHTLGENAEVAAWERTQAAKVIGRSRLECPRGHGRMTAYGIESPPHSGQDLEVEVCPTCTGMWLDAWEATRLQQATRTLTPASGAPSTLPADADKNDGVGWYLFGLVTGMPVEEYNPRRRFPLVCTALILACVGVFFVELSWMGAGRIEEFVRTYGAVPKTMLQGYAPQSIVTHMFLHGGVAHLVGNMYFLYTFGDNIEDRVGRARFLVLYLLFGLAALGLQVLTSLGSDVPMVGASGAISGLMGAYLALFPKARMYQVILFFRFRVPAWAYLGLWMLLQSFSGWHSIINHSSGGVAWFAHIGGFCAGVAWGLFARDKFGDGAELRRA
jgi:membrane associated rhomboid family serine protease/Zn-finger nucleic acid-binding protein